MRRAAVASPPAAARPEIVQGSAVDDLDELAIASGFVNEAGDRAALGHFDPGEFVFQDVTGCTGSRLECAPGGATDLEAFEAQASPKDKAAAQKAKLAVARTRELLDYLFQTKEAITQGGEGG